VTPSPDSRELSTARDKSASTVLAGLDDLPDDQVAAKEQGIGELGADGLIAEEAGDLASDALRSARAIATGRAGGRTPGRYARQRRRAAGAPGGGYSGARPDERDPMSIGAIVDRSMTELGWVGPLAEARLLGHWASVVGPEIASRCQPVSLVDGELKISAESTAWATQLRLMAPQLLARICREMPAGTVRRLAISGPSGPSWKRGPWSMRGGRGVRDTYG
jgi:predicted nucleic acid-binding Zn ribbon protein